MDKVYIIIVNWNGWKDTIECLESVFRNDYPSYQVVVCDNGSVDGSLDRIKAWAKGELLSDVPRVHPLHALSSPPIAKPVTFEEYSRAEAEADFGRIDTAARLILIRIETNLGFAGGNNVGLRYALSRGDFGHAWLLNNDVVIRPDALTRLVERMRDKKDAGMCGSTILYYSAPDTVWTLGGGEYSRWLARSRSIGNQQLLRHALFRYDVERTMDYLAGASMLVSRAFLKDIGLMNEDYFLYYEEPDWALRAKGRYTLAYAPESTVYHKVGASTGLLDTQGKSRKSSEFYAMKSHLLFTRKFFPYFMPFVLVRVCFHSFFVLLKNIVFRFK